MANYTQIYYHIVFSTKYREKTLDEENREELYRYIWGVITKKKCVLYQIGGVEDHLHILTDLHPTVALSDLIKSIKGASSHMIKKDKLFPNFRGWQKNYGAFTIGVGRKSGLIKYIKNQKAHHSKGEEFEKELVRLYDENKVEYDIDLIFE